MKNKKLLVLGGGIYADYIIDYANKNSIQLGTTSNLKKGILKERIKEKYDVNTTDIEGMKKLIKDKHFDGVFVGGNETNIKKSISYLNNLHMHSYVTKETWDICQNKSEFKKACIKVGLPVPEIYEVNRINANFNHFPIVIKPADSCGSNGVVLCNTFDEYLEKFESTSSFSSSGQVIAEEYLNTKEISVHYTIKDGEAKLSSMSDKYESTHCGSFNPIPDCYCYPSVYLNLFLKKYDKKIKELFKYLGVKEGIAFVQGFCDGRDIKFFEMGYRLPGTCTFKYTKYLNDICALDLLLDYSMGIKNPKYDLNKENANFTKYCCTMTMLSKGGHVNKILGIDEIKMNKNIISIEQRYNVGDNIKVTNSLAQAHIWVYIAADSINELKSTIKFVNENVKVLDENNQEILYHDFDVERLLFK